MLLHIVQGSVKVLLLQTRRSTLTLLSLVIVGGDYQRETTFACNTAVCNEMLMTKRIFSEYALQKRPIATHISCSCARFANKNISLSVPSRVNCTGGRW